MLSADLAAAAGRWPLFVPVATGAGFRAAHALPLRPRGRVAASETRTLTDQLHEALDSRLAIEQAEGVLAEQAGIGMDEAFARLRRHARAHQRRLADVAQEVVGGALTAAELAPEP